ncbi:MAG: farnesyl diphosphate synthase [Pseudomonadota bacterium]
MELNDYLTQRRRIIEQALDEALPESGALTGKVVEAMRYSLFAGGKRLRPILCLAGAEAVGAPPETALPAAVAVEMIHTYSLIHDDLPAMDDDDLRRGQPSNHVVFGEGLAILAGDGLLTLGFRVLAKAGLVGRVPPERALAALDLVAESASPEGMVGGQAVDLLAEGHEVDEELVKFLHQKKTAALIAASLAAGATLGGGSETQVSALENFGRRLGLAFQITDDILDIEGDPARMGKPAGSDQALEKATYPKVVGLKKAKETAVELAAEAKTFLDGFGPEADPLRAIADYLVLRKK